MACDDFDTKLKNAANAWMVAGIKADRERDAAVERGDTEAASRWQAIGDRHRQRVATADGGALLTSREDMRDHDFMRAHSPLVAAASAAGRLLIGEEGE